ncbi:MAG: hypothetical protein R3F20_15485 [Planctomycetota bacterium]
MRSTIPNAVRVGLCAMALLMGATSVRAQDGAKPVPDEKSRREQLEFRQKKAIAHMQELEDRMFQLAELLGDAEPDHSMRLIMGLQKSREDLIVEEMEEVTGLIKEEAWDAAEEKQRQVLFRLRELRELLLSTDLDLLLKLQRLRKLNRGLLDLAKIAKEEERLGGASEELAKAESPDDEQKKRMESLARAQAENRKLAEILRAEMAEIADSEMKASERLDEAGKAMKSAERPLERGRAEDARKPQKDAREKLEEAKKDLEAARERLLKELQRFIRKAILQSLFQMIDNQTRVNEDLTLLTSSSPDLAIRRRRARVQPKRIEDRQREVVTLARDAVQLLEETQYAVALPWSVRYIQEWAEPNVAPIAAQKATRSEIRRGEKVIADCRELADILMEEDKYAKQSEGNDRAERTVKLLAELRTLRYLQDRVLADTLLAVEGERKSLSEDELRILRKVRAIRNWEATLRELTLEIDRRGAAELLGGDNDEGF